MGQATKIMLIRHAEKPGIYDGKNCEGIRSDGDREKDSLIVRGWQRAGALCVLFGSAGVAGARGLAVPAHLYASDPDRDFGIGSNSRRPKETLSPLSKRLGIDTNLDFIKGEEADLAAAAIAAGGVVLVSWQHENIPAIARHIPGGDVPGTRDWPDDRYDMIWVFDLGDAGRYTFRQVPQALLAGDEGAGS